MSDDFKNKVTGLISILLPDTITAVESKKDGDEIVLVFSTFNQIHDCLGVIKVEMDEGKPLNTCSRRGIYACQISNSLIRQLDALILSYNLRGNNA